MRALLAAVLLAVVGPAVPVEAQNLPPVAAITAAPETGTVGTLFYFNGSGSADPDGWIGAYFWILGDGDFASGLDVMHGYAAPGWYTVTLVVTDNGGLNDTDTAQVNVTGENHLPEIQAWSPADSVVAVGPGDLQAFSVTATDPDEDALTYTWRVDGRLEATGDSRFYTYAATSGGIHTVEVAVSDGRVAQNQSWTVQVVQSPPPPAASEGPSFLPLLAASLVVAVVLVLMAVALARGPPKFLNHGPPVPRAPVWCHHCGATLDPASGSCPACRTPRFRG